MFESQGEGDGPDMQKGLQQDALLFLAQYLKAQLSLVFQNQAVSPAKQIQDHSSQWVQWKHQAGSAAEAESRRQQEEDALCLISRMMFLLWSLTM